MNVYSATDAISPAINRTKSFLFEPFKWTTYLKLCLVACLCAGSGGGIGGNFSNGFPGSGHSAAPAQTGAPALTPAIQAMLTSPAFWIGLAAVLLLIVIPLGLVIAYLITRLRFAFFHCLVEDTQQIGPGWRIYGAQAMRFFLLSIVVGLVMLLALAALVAPVAVKFYALVKNMTPGQNFDFFGFLSLLIPLFGLLMVFALAGYLVEIVLHDFMLPHMALDNATVGQAWAAACERIGRARGSFALYALLRALIGFAAGIGAILVAIIPMLIVIGVCVGGVALMFVSIKHSPGGAAFLLIPLIILLVVAGLIACMAIGIAVGGPVATWKRYYALYFYGGRYQALGDLLSPSVPPPAGFAGAPQGV